MGCTSFWLVAIPVSRLPGFPEALDAGEEGHGGRLLAYWIDALNDASPAIPPQDLAECDIISFSHFLPLQVHALPLGSFLSSTKSYSAPISVVDVQA